MKKNTFTSEYEFDPKPREPSAQELQKIARDAVSDSLEIFRWGLVNKLDIGTMSFDLDRDPEFLKKPEFKDFNIQNDFNDLSLKPILHVIFKICLNLTKNECSLDSDLFKIACIAHHKARLSLNEASKLNGAIAFCNLIKKLNKNISWRNGLMSQDILDIYINKILSPQILALDFSCFIQLRAKFINLSKSKKNLNSKKSMELFSAECNKLLSDQFHSRINDIKSAIRECLFLRHLEHEANFDPGIDIGCTSLGFYRSEFESGNLKFILGSNGEFKLFPLFNYGLRTVEDITSSSKLEYNENEDTYSKSRLGFDESSGSLNKVPYQITPRPGEEINEERDRQASGLYLLSGTGGLIVWRGSKYSFHRALDEITIILPSAIRTAWLVTGGSKEVFSYLIDPLYRFPDFGNRSPRVLSPYNQPVIPSDIETYPKDYFVCTWIKDAFTQLFSESNHNNDQQFIPSALRLLKDADKQLKFSPRQSFAISMAAAELCLGNKEAGSDKLARRMSRLLVAKNDYTRTKGMDLFKLLYDFRSKIVHGSELDVSLAAAIFMRYVASCVVFNFASYSKFLMRRDGGAAGSLKNIWNLLDRDDRGPELLPGVIECSYLNQLIERDIKEPDAWVNINI